MADQTYEHAWAAGFLDGEGSFCLLKCSHKGVKSSTRRPAIHATQINEKPLEKLQELYGGAIYESATPRGRVCFQWALVGAEVILNATPLLIPHLLLKREEAEALLAYAKTMGQRGKVLTLAQIEERQSIIYQHELARARK